MTVISSLKFFTSSVTLQYLLLTSFLAKTLRSCVGARPVKFLGETENFFFRTLIISSLFSNLWKTHLTIAWLTLKDQWWPVCFWFNATLDSWLEGMGEPFEESLQSCIISFSSSPRMSVSPPPELSPPLDVDPAVDNFSSALVSSINLKCMENFKWKYAKNMLTFRRDAAKLLKIVKVAQKLPSRICLGPTTLHSKRTEANNHM